MHLLRRPRFECNIDIGTEEKLNLLKKMLLIRYAEEHIASMVEAKEVKTPCHLYIGQEAVAVGACALLLKEDYLFSNHRAHGHFLAKGGSVKELFAEVLCRADGCSGGRGGSMHLCSPENGIMGTSSIVGGSLGICTGPAMAAKIRKDGRVSVVFHGDTVLEEGIWHESANFSALYKLPMIYVCENNLYSAHMSLLERRVEDNLCEVARAHRLNVWECDGNDVLQVYETMKKAVELARSGKGAQFIECRTYRWRGHVGANDDIDKGLRSKEELDYWKSRCPIKNYEEYLIIHEIANEGMLEQIQNEQMHIVEEAIEYARNCPYPKVETLLNNVYVEREKKVCL